MSTKEVVTTVWNTYQRNIKNVHDFTGRAIESVMRMSLQKKSFDNVTVVFVAFASLEKFLAYKKQQNWFPIICKKIFVFLFWRI